MATQETGDDDIDTETLQAQIDLSMSLVHDLVSSWVKPSQKTVTKPTHDAQKELEEYMRRPARLGVGAPIPESSLTSRDTARLKGQLTNGKKRTRDGEEDAKGKSLPSDDDEESRAGVIRKKVKLDPFDGGKKKKKKKTNGLPTPQYTPASSQDQGAHNKVEVSQAMDIDPAEENGIPPPISSEGTISGSSRKKKKKRKQVSIEHPPNVELASPPLTPIRKKNSETGPGSTASNSTPLSLEDATYELPRTHVSDSMPGDLMANDHHSATKVAPTISNSTQNIMLSPSRAKMSQGNLATLKLPLLNLDGPPQDVSEPEGEVSPLQTGSPKKKRKRRKKKKNMSATAPSEPTISAS